ncbi:hypothetical protein HPB50_012592 [Hyalomma asiaticum]|uniref:Uncharacterized protein n=1 Tax=Hyalomma asiaticum TaxID=266040 RepID=A0ACB7RZT0_HYAAI|nr:hypothetical protein HPB50_012592 [Hyalomma asiaticum]
MQAYHSDVLAKQIRVVNAFRSNLDARNNPAYQTALLRKASAASPSGTGTGFVRSQLHSQPHTSTSAGAGFASPKEETAASSSVAAAPSAAASSPPGREPQQASPPAGAKEGDATSNHSVETAV